MQRKQNKQQSVKKSNLIKRKVKKYLLFAGLLISLAPDASAQSMGENPACDSIKTGTFSTLKTNAVYDAIMVPNLTYEHYLGNGYSVGLTWWYTWWRSRLMTTKMHHYWRSYGGELNFRKYFGAQARRKPLTGHHVDFLFQGYMYDSDHGNDGYMSDFSYNIGFEYGYSMPLLRRLNLDLGIGAGYVGGKYKIYHQRDMHYVWKETKQRSFLGPIKVEITLAYQLGKDNINPGKNF